MRMNKLTLDEQWPALKEKAGAFFPALNHADWSKIDQDVRQFSPILQQRYGYDGAKAEAEIDRFLANHGDGNSAAALDDQSVEGQPGVPRPKKAQDKASKLVENVNDAPDAVKAGQDKGADNNGSPDKKELLEDLKADSLGGMSQLDSRAT